MDSRKIVLRETGVILAGELVCLGLMWLVFALLGRLDRPVWLGGIIGTALAVLNFFLMAVNVSNAADKAAAQDVQGGRNLVRISYILRLAGIFAVLFVLVKSGVCHPVASVLPLVFVRPVITLASFFRKKPEPPQAAPEPDAEDED